MFVCAGLKTTFSWQDHMHDKDDERWATDPQCLNVLQNSRLLKLFLTPLLSAQLDLLEYLIWSWNPMEGKFIIHGQEVDFDATDIYFLTGLSRWGERPRMGSVRITEDSLDILITRVFPRAWKSSTSGKLQIPMVNDLSLRVLLFTITRVASSQAQHKATKTQLWLALDFLIPTMFY